jgi:hypothetical protein
LHEGIIANTQDSTASGKIKKQASEKLVEKIKKFQKTY